MLVVERKYTLDDLHIGMAAKEEQLSEIYNKYTILLYKDMDSSMGKLMYCKGNQDKEDDSWFMQPKPITPIFNERDELGTWLYMMKKYIQIDV